MSKKYDVIIIGGGHNGLTTGAYLAKAGLKTLILERRYLVGGATVSEELYPGFKYTVCSYVISMLRPEVIRELELPKYGLEILPLEGLFAPTADGDYLALWNDHSKTREEIKRHCLQDADAYDEFGLMLYHMAFAVKPILAMIPPDITSPTLSDLRNLGRLKKHIQQLGSEKFYMLSKLMTMSSADLLDEWFETDILKALFAFSSIIGTLNGPRSPGSAYVLLHHFMGELDGQYGAWGFHKGGTGGLSQAIANAARHLGAEIRCNASVSDVISQNGRAAGVALDSGEEIYADIVVSSLDPRQTFLKLVDPKQLPGDFVDAIGNYKFRGSSGKVNLALDGLPEFTAMPDPSMLRANVELCISMDYLERAFDDAKYGNFSKQPFMDILIPSMFDPTMAPPGKHVMSIFVQYAPYELNGGWNDEQRDAFGDAVIDTLAEFAPNIKDLIVHRQVLTPWDMEREFGLSEGNIFHGELTLDQVFFFRPVPGWAKYRTPLRNYYLCGSGVHPGGGITSAPGRLAALEILKDLKK